MKTTIGGRFEPRQGQRRCWSPENPGGMPLGLGFNEDTKGQDAMSAETVTVLAWKLRRAAEILDRDGDEHGVAADLWSVLANAGCAARLRAKHSRHGEQEGEDADAIDEIGRLRKDAELLAWVLEHPETAAECLEDAAAGDGTGRSNLERRIVAVSAPLQRQVRPCAWISEYGLSELTTDSEKLGSLEWEVKRNKERGYDVPLYTQIATGEHADRLHTALEDARRALHDIAEEWAGAECDEPVQEAYAIALARRMYGIAAAALRVEGDGA